ncbi:hypothetical protein D9757_008149 [Collybiopsis confluens]|uniref:AsqO/PenF-like C-terminal domain-containing protein n=1 Tax=Collybiopsis confluens TaxID=2823264 RepID=A0A8H5HE15_9AGAR|nr:hypothetical protein D9757_008149 [Collybiopsis confluens]
MDHIPSEMSRFIFWHLSGDLLRVFGRNADPADFSLMLVSFLAIASTLALPSSPIIIPPTSYDGLTTAQYTASSYKIDAPREHQLHGTGRILLRPPRSILRIVVRAGDDIYAETVWADSAELYTSIPTHLPCSLNEIGASLVLTPGVGWVNPVLEAKANVDLKINDTIVQFQGHGYHDTTWGNVPFSEAQGSLFFAHAKIGPYAFVIYVQELHGGKQISSSFVSKDGHVLSVSCSRVNVEIGFNHLGLNSTTGPVKNAMVEIAIENGEVFEVYLTVSDILFSSGSTYHGNGFVRGGARSEGRNHSGIATFEYVEPLPPSFQT